MAIRLALVSTAAALVPCFASTAAAAGAGLDALAASPSGDACSEEGALSGACSLSLRQLRRAAVLGSSTGSSGSNGSSWQGIGRRCNASTLRIDYGRERCEMDESGAFHLRCESPDTRKCGARLASERGYGLGRYSVKMKAAKEPGLVTAFYLYTDGDHKRSRPWSEIDIEVLGTTTRRAWTNFFTLPFDANEPFWKIQREHPKWIDLPFDASADFHTYTIKVGPHSISWLVDGKTYRVEDVGNYTDLMSRVAEKQFEVQFSFWGQNLTSRAPFWGAEGFLEDVGGFPVTASFKDLTLSK